MEVAVITMTEAMEGVEVEMSVEEVKVEMEEVMEVDIEGWRWWRRCRCSSLLWQLLVGLFLARSSITSWILHSCFWI